MPPTPVLWVGQPAVPVTLPGRPQLQRLVALVSAVAALPLAFQASSQWLPIQMWRNAVPFGQADPVLGHDVGFYVFTLPGRERWARGSCFWWRWPRSAALASTCWADESP